MNLTVINRYRVYPRRPAYQNAKRFVDLTLCLLAFPIALPVMLLCMLAILIDSGHPIFFVQERIGRGGKPFKIYKFRTWKAVHDQTQGRSFMKSYIRGEVGQEEGAGGTFKPKTEALIFPVGRFLRRTSLDEIPQLINVIRGEMSLVGPRPNVPWEVFEYRPWHYERLEVLPGITGLAQVSGRSGISFNSIVRYDIRYIENQSLMLDLTIIFRTLRSVVLSKGAG